MLQTMGSQRVAHGLATEKQEANSLLSLFSTLKYQASKGGGEEPHIYIIMFLFKVCVLRFET